MTWTDRRWRTSRSGSPTNSSSARNNTVIWSGPSDGRLPRDRWSSALWLPAVLTLWSLVGFSTGLVQSYSGLLVCRSFLGLFEAGHWPCALKTTQRLLAPADRTMGNGVLQSGASIGAVLTPLVMKVMLTREVGSWRLSFLVIGAVGVIWILFWLVMMQSVDLKPVPSATSQVSPDPSPGASFWKVVCSRRFLVLCIVVACINTSWQLLRAWLPKILQQGRGYSESDALYFNSLYFVATDIGCLGAGALTLWLTRRGLSVHKARRLVCLLCALLTTLATVAAVLPKGWLLLGVLLVVGAGALGLFPCFYSWSQELTTRHQGKVTGLTGVAAWALAPAHRYLGQFVDQTGSFDLALAILGWAPLLGFVFLWLFWDGRKAKPQIDSRT
ncbi:MAG: hypothetical protein DME26_00490 [Verrucomicrobia bacterium]|nr:MAG: hypothetical protein DME26_00490 [Verrucomicrobiota bacterium]